MATLNPVDRLAVRKLGRRDALLLRRARRHTHLVVGLALVAGAGVAQAQLVLVNNGLNFASAPQNDLRLAVPDLFTGDLVVQNAGCDARVQDPCVQPGAATAVRLYGTDTALPQLFVHAYVRETSSFHLALGRISSIEAREASNVVVEAGSATFITGRDASTIELGSTLSQSVQVTLQDDARLTMLDDSLVLDAMLSDRSRLEIDSGGVLSEVRGSGEASVALRGGGAATIQLDDFAAATIEAGFLTYLDADDAASAVVTGGSVGTLSAYGSSRIEIRGRSFQLDGVPVPGGPLAADAGQLTGTLESGDPIDALVIRYSTATIELPEPTAAPGALCVAVALLMLRVRAGRRTMRAAALMGQRNYDLH